jgi:hypothetical protein
LLEHPVSKKQTGVLVATLGALAEFSNVIMLQQPPRQPGPGFVVAGASTLAQFIDPLVPV